MKNKLVMATLAAAMVGPAIAPAPVLAATHNGNHVYYNGKHRYHRHCGGGNGAVGTVAGGVGGAVIGKAVLGGPVGLVAGAVGGGLLGRHFDKQHTRNRHRC